MGEEAFLSLFVSFISNPLSLSLSLSRTTTAKEATGGRQRQQRWSRRVGGGGDDERGGSGGGRARLWRWQQRWRQGIWWLGGLAAEAATAKSEARGRRPAMAKEAAAAGEMVSLCFYSFIILF